LGNGITNLYHCEEGKTIEFCPSSGEKKKKKRKGFNCIFAGGQGCMDRAGKQGKRRKGGRPYDIT